MSTFSVVTLLLRCTFDMHIISYYVADTFLPQVKKI